MSLKAVFSQGYMGTGVTHGDAFGKLPPHVKSGNEFLSGTWDVDTDRFEGDGQSFSYAKTILLVRHGDPAAPYDVNPDPGLSEAGALQVRKVAVRMRSEKYDGFEAFCSPYLRCLETAAILRDALGLRVTVDPWLAYDPGARDHAAEFLGAEWVRRGAEPASRARAVLDRLPPKCVVVSHSAVIEDLTRLIDAGAEGGVPTASMTLVLNKKVLYVGRVAD